MPFTILFPLNEIQPGQLLNDYSEWIYFTLIMIFFISVSGITLRRHFDKPYVKPLIISTGLIMTVGVFMMKQQLTIIIQGWGIIGSLLLVFMAATIPFGLCRGFGMSSHKAFYLTYILIYILSWVKYPDLYYILADHNLGLVNLGLLILFLVAIYKTAKIKGLGMDLSTEMKTQSPLKNEIDHELQVQDDEIRAIKKKGEKVIKFETKTVRDIEEALAKIHQIIETNRNNLPTEARKAIAENLAKITKAENVFMKGLWRLKKTFKSINIMDEKQFNEMQERLNKVSGKEKRILETEIKLEEEKIKIEHSVLECEKNLEKWLNYFNNFLHLAIKAMQESAYPYDAMPYLTKARVVLKDILSLLQKIKALEDKLLQLTKGEKKLLKKERKTA